LSGFFFGERLRGNWHISGVDADLFEDIGFELFVLLMTDEPELSAEESDLSLVPLEGAVDVLVELEGRVFGSVLV
jgi:hypothetical protein